MKNKKKYLEAHERDKENEKNLNRKVLRKMLKANNKCQIIRKKKL